MTIRADFARPTAAELEALAAFAPATLHEAMGQKGAMPGWMKPLYPDMRVCGAALTVDCPPGDNLSIHAAVERAEPGDVLVVDYKGFLESGPFGDILATACLARGVRGMVIDGCVRDGATIRELGFPIFARGLNMKGTVKMRLGAVGVPITCAGVVVAPGDAVVGDDDGVAVVPRALIATVAQAAREREDKEAAMRAKLEAGATTVELLGLRPLLRTGG